MSIEFLFKTDPYSMGIEEKRGFFTPCLRDLTKHHYQNCNSYKKMLDGLQFEIEKEFQYDEIPFIPVRLFKNLDLRSISQEEILKTMTSSGTTGQSVSKIFLDKETSLNQSKALVVIVSSFLGSRRSPMLIIDSSTVLKDRNMFSARGAGILGFSIFGTKVCYALDDDMSLNKERVGQFIDENKGKNIFIFGFTFMVYQHFIKELRKSGLELDLGRGALIHGGGWKKMQSESITQQKFKDELYELCRIKSVHDYYGMVEQTGSIYMECEKGNLHASLFSDIIIRNPDDFSISPIGQKGIIQTLSVLPKSYPGHSLLTEDEGTLLGEDDCACGRLGKYFKISGRIQEAELRGCSDTYVEG